jgi:hypothetical protein
LLEYEDIIARGIQFEDVAGSVPPKVLLSMVFAGKRKKVIPLEVSDFRILNWAIYLKVDFSAVDGRVVPDESRTVVPLELLD